MNFLIIYIFYAIIALLMFVSFKVNKDKFNLAIKESWKSANDLGIIILFVVFFLAFFGGLLSGDFVVKYFDVIKGPFGVFGAAVIGSIVHVPPFIAFPIGGRILESGVSPGIIAVLINTLIMVHTFTIPIEIKEMGWKFAVVRNGLSFVFAIVIGVIIGVIY